MKITTPNAKSITHYYAATAAILIIFKMGDPIWVKCGMLTQNGMTITAISSKSKLKNMMD